MRTSSRPKYGLTLVELLVVIAIVGLLVAMAIPAAQQVREAARRTMCQNNLRQIGLALNHHHAALSELPVGCVEWRSFIAPNARQLAWSAYLLPYLEQDPIFQSLDFSQPFDSVANTEAATIRLPVYLCPSAATGDSADRPGRCDYGGIYGERISGPNHPPKGTMLIDQPVKFRDITDGLSQTLVVGEDTGWGDGQWINGRNIFDQAFAINHAPDFENDLRSNHLNGVNVLFVDGHVRFLANETSLELLASICTRAGGEVTPLNE